jgi:hypothetical protein
MLQRPNPLIPGLEERELLISHQQRVAAFERLGRQNRAALNRMLGAAVGLDDPADEELLGDA